MDLSSNIILLLPMQAYAYPGEVGLQTKFKSLISCCKICNYMTKRQYSGLHRQNGKLPLTINGNEEIYLSEKICDTFSKWDANRLSNSPWVLNHGPLVVTHELLYLCFQGKGITIHIGGFSLFQAGNDKA